MEARKVINFPRQTSTMLSQWQRTTAVMHNLIFWYMIMIRMSFLPLERWLGRFQSTSECQLRSWQGDWYAIWINKEQRIPMKLIRIAFPEKQRQAKNKHAPKSHTYGRASLPPRLYIHSAETAASLCPVTFSFPLSLVLLVRPAEHRDHSFIALLE